MKKNNSILPLTSLQYYLTIRYFPKEKSIITPITAKNFQDKYSDPNGIKTEKILKEIIKKTLTNQSGSCVISLSGGIDSTLCLGLVRNVFPKKKITGICAIFENAFDESKAAKKVADKLRKEAENTASGMINEAKKQTDKIMEKARRKAEKIKQDAQKKIK